MVLTFCALKILKSLHLDLVHLFSYEVYFVMPVWQDDTRELKTVPWYKNFRYISIALIIIALLEYWWFF